MIRIYDEDMERHQNQNYCNDCAVTDFSGFNHLHT